jgi:toxin-antitoxin system PIN domain toxin
MIIPDANLLIYAYDARSPDHQKARIWWANTLAGKEPVGLPWVVLLAFSRLMTHPQICQNPLSIQEVCSITDQWWECPQLRLVQPSDRAVTVFFDLLEVAAMGGNLSTDALIAACAREHSATIYSNDRDFDRFPGIRRVNPLT